MNREDEVLNAVTELADTLIDDYDVVEFLHRLATVCVEILDASEAGIMLADEHGVLHYLASSSERMRLIELFELQHDQGPCVDAFRSGVAVRSSMADADIERWPRVAPHVRESGFGSVAAIPMRLRSNVIGALNLFSISAEALSDQDQHVAQALADVATIGILHERALNDAHIVTSQLQSALNSRVVIEQAKGMIAAYNHIGVDDAFTALRRYARNHNRLLSQVPQEVTVGSIAPSLIITSVARKRD